MPKNNKKKKTIGDCIESFIIANNLDKSDVCVNLQIDLNFLEMNIEKSGLVAKQIYDKLINYYSS